MAESSDVERTEQSMQRTASIVHLSTRELHDFLFGPSDRHFPTATVHLAAGVKKDGGEKRGRTESLQNDGKSFDGSHNFHFGSQFRVRGHGGGAAAFHDISTAFPRKCMAGHFLERSEAAAKAAWRSGGSGWCLLQKFIGPTGSRNSTLR